MIAKVFTCPVCGVLKLQNKSVGEYKDPFCTGDGVNGHNSGMSFVYETDLTPVGYRGIYTQEEKAEFLAELVSEIKTTEKQSDE